MMPPIRAGALRVAMQLQGPVLKVPPKRPYFCRARAVRREEDVRIGGPTVERPGRVQEELLRPVDVLITADQGSKDEGVGILRLETRDLPDQQGQVAGLPSRSVVVDAFLIGITGGVDVLTAIAH